MKKKEFFRRCFAMLMIFMLTLNIVTAVFAESYSANVMRLLNYEGEVYILDADGNARVLMENVRFNSGESLSTGAKAMASVSLDETKILTLDSMTQVAFVNENNHMTLTLSSGRLLLDVQEKLDENETFDIQTSTMTVGIRGTLVYVASFDGSEEEINKALLESNAAFRELLNRSLPDNYSGKFSQLVVLEGAAVATYQDENAHARSVEVHAGEKITVVEDRREEVPISQAMDHDLGSDIVEFIKNDPALLEKVNEASDILNADTNKQETETGIIEENEPDEKEPIVPDDIPPEHVHDFSPTFIPPTCTQDGEIIYVCVCGESFTVSGGSALGHDWGPWSVVTAATTESDGQEMCQCTRCGETLLRIIPKLDPTPTPAPPQTPTPAPTVEPDPSPAPHVHVPKEPVYENEVPAFCTEEGSREAVTYCETCGEEIKRTSEAVPALGHNWGEWETVAEPTCTEGGQRQHTCQRCGETNTEALPANGHTPVTVAAIAATCTKSGWTEHIYCAVCEEVLEPYQEEIPALGHNWGEWETVRDATCGAAGLQRRICQRAGCGAEEEKEIPATSAHVKPEKPVIEKDVPETCTTGHSFEQVMYCAVCGAEMERQSYTSDAPGHNWGTWECDQEPTCTKGGQRHRTCQRCGETATEILPANGHTPITDPPIAATCTESGWTEHIYCEVCEDAIEPYQKEVPALGHDWGEWETVKDATCGVEGLQRRTCQRAGCGAKEEKTIPATGVHVPGAPTVEDEQPATCTESYHCNHVTRCSNCSAVLSSERYSTGVPLGHNYVWQTVNEPTCTEPGQQQYICTRCNDISDSKTLPVKEHHYVLHDTDNKPVLIDEANETYEMMLCYIYKCEYCSDEYWEPVEGDDPPIGYPTD